MYEEELNTLVNERQSIEIPDPSKAKFPIVNDSRMDVLSQ